jgi:hypothetical protein
MICSCRSSRLRSPVAGPIMASGVSKTTLTEGPGGGFLDNGSAFGVYSRLDLYKAAEQAAALSAKGK